MKKFISVLLCVCIVCSLSLTAFASGSSTTPLYPYGNYTYISNWKNLTTSSVAYFDAVIGSFRSLITALNNIYLSVDGLEADVSSIKTDTASIKTAVTTYLVSINKSLLDAKADLATMDSSLANIDTSTKNVSTNVNTVKTDVSTIKTNQSLAYTALLDIKSLQSTLNDTVSTAKKQDSILDYLGFFNRTMVGDHDRLYSSLFSSDFYTPTIETSSDGKSYYRSTSYLINASFVAAMSGCFGAVVDGLLLLANVVADPQDQEIRDNTVDQKTTAGDYIKTTATADKYSGALGLNNTLSDALNTGVSIDDANSAVSSFTTDSSAEAWTWFSQPVLDDLDPSAGSVSTLSLDDESESFDDDVVWVLDPYASADSILDDFFAGIKGGS